MLSLSKYERALRFSSLTLQVVFQSLPFVRLRTGKMNGQEKMLMPGVW
ncbi:MAG: hypothetical protein LBD67_03510 [Candidatus Accumulibacter sp.]|nr:hypothetical protein [Accumulibacter sp.]